MNNRATTLLVMAAGMGSRFGGLKQIIPVDDEGRAILDYTLYDARKAGFNKVVFVIKHAIEKDFRETIGKRAEKIIDTAYVFQEVDNLPKGLSAPARRTKPYGTGHAVWCARNAVSTPFAVVNADDFYGFDSFKQMHNHLNSCDDIGMISFKLSNTLTENGTVSRGVCTVRDGYLVDVTEHIALDEHSGLPTDTPVSMNFWGFQPDFYDTLEKELVKWFAANRELEKGEFFLPFAVDTLIKTGKERVRVYNTDGKWYGITYREDLPAVQAAIRCMVSNGSYCDM